MTQAPIKKGPFAIECRMCGEGFEAATPNALYCRQHRGSRVQTKGVFEDLPSKFRGTASELKAVVDLWHRGYEVYGSMAPHGSVDLIAYGENQDLLRIEVTSGRTREDGKIYYHPHPRHQDRRDLICVILPADEILYFDSDGNTTTPDGHRMLKSEEQEDGEWVGSRILCTCGHTRGAHVKDVCLAKSCRCSHFKKGTLK